jgi:hypothetical protein
MSTVARYLVCFAIVVLLTTSQVFAVELPTSIPGLLHHWDAFNPMGTGVKPAAGPYAGPWVDLAGTNDANVSFGTPVYNPGNGTTIGAQPTFRFTTADAFSSIAPINDQTVTIFSVSKLNGGSNQRLITGTSNNYLLGYHGNIEDTGFNGNWFGGSPAATTDKHMYIHEARNDTSDVLWEADVLIPNTRGPGAGTAIGNLGFGGRAWSAAEASNGDISEIIVFDSDMSAANRQAVGLYLAQKYGFVAFGHDGTVLGGGAVPEPTAILAWAVSFVALLGFAFAARRKKR